MQNFLYKIRIHPFHLISLMSHFISLQLTQRKLYHYSYLNENKKKIVLSYEADTDTDTFIPLHSFFFLSKLIEHCIYIFKTSEKR